MRTLVIVLCLIGYAVSGQIPDGYYDSALGLSGQQLRETLQEIIDDHQEQTYASIWTHFQTTDDDLNGNVWDMYSDIPGGNPVYIYTFVTDQCGNYSAEGDCYNREHSFPKSWFDDAPPMVTDMFQIYPTDGFVNGKRSNYPYGEVVIASWISTNGSKVGNCSFTGYSGIVFEPIDEYKGDFARTYFYMMTRYMDQVSSWSSDMLYGNDLAGWAKELLVEWDWNDPVSQKEIDRNNSVYQVQNNRNPFIDHPEFTGLIWGVPTFIENDGIRDVKFWYANNMIHIERPEREIGHIMIINVLGIPIASWLVEDNYTGIKLDLYNGIYLLIFDDQQDRRSFKFIVQN